MPTEFHRARGGSRDLLAVDATLAARAAGKAAVVLVPNERARDALLARWPTLDPSWVVTPGQAIPMGYTPAQTASKAARVAEEKRQERLGRAAVARRSHGLCELKIPDVCTKWQDSVHHRLPRGGQGDWHPDNLIATCGDGTRGCHGWVEHHRTEGYERGWLVHRGTDPRSVPWSPWVEHHA